MSRDLTKKVIESIKEHGKNNNPMGPGPENACLS